MAKLAPPSRSANHRGVVVSRFASSNPCIRNAASSSSLPGFASRRTRMPTVIKFSTPLPARNWHLLNLGFGVRFNHWQNCHIWCQCAMRVCVLALDGVFDLGLSAILDAFQTANELIEMTGLAVPLFEVKIVGMRKMVRTAHGLKVPIQLIGRQTPEYVIVPAIACKTLDTLKAALA